MSTPQGTVLVTGGTGFLGSWCIADLLNRGYQVRTTIRDLAKESTVRDMATTAGADGSANQLAVLAANLDSDTGWAEAVAGCDYVLHVASPFPPEQPKDPDELIVPARDGALRVLTAALDAGVKRVVQTSSIAAIRPERKSTAAQPFTEEDWTDGDDPARTPYVRSKTIAERAAWNLAEERGATDRLATVNPGAIIGPVLGPGRSYSLQVVERLLGGMPAIPRLGFSFVDVRDVADLHIRAMAEPAAAGQRFIATKQFAWMPDVAASLRESLGYEGMRIPTRTAPNVLIRLMSRFDGSLKSIVGDLGVQSWFANDKAVTTLGWQPRALDVSFEETARSLLAAG